MKLKIVGCNFKTIGYKFKTIDGQNSFPIRTSHFTPV